MIEAMGNLLQRFWFAMAGHLWQTAIVLALLAVRWFEKRSSRKDAGDSGNDSGPPD